MEKIYVVCTASGAFLNVRNGKSDTTFSVFKHAFKTAETAEDIRRVYEGSSPNLIGLAVKVVSITLNVEA